MISLPIAKEKLAGEYSLLRKFKSTLFIKYCSLQSPGGIYAVDFKKTGNNHSLDEIFEASSITLIESAQINSTDSEFVESFDKTVGEAKTELVRLENGAEGMFIRPGNLDLTKKHPLIVQSHGGPFGQTHWGFFSKTRNILLMQGYCILAINFRGSTGYGEDNMNSLLGTIGINDVEDCGELTIQTLEKYKDFIDANRVGVEGGSHGGFLTGWLTGHPKYRHLFHAACLWNAVLNMSYMLTATDIPDWITGCTQNKEFDFANITA